jgi:hypothetical protein
MLQTIKPLESYGRMSDGEIVTTSTAVQTGMNGNSNFPNSPVDLAVLKTDTDKLSALMAEALDGSKKVIAEKNNQRSAVVLKLRLLGRYVEVTSKNDVAVFQSSGFVPASNTKAQPPALSQNFRSIDHGDNSGQTVVRLKAVPEAAAYELRYAPVVNGSLPQASPPWTTLPVRIVRPAVRVTGLTPGTTYAFQVRSLVKSGYTDWCDPVMFMCT